MSSVRPGSVPQGKVEAFLHTVSFYALCLMAVSFPFSFALFNIGAAALSISFGLKRFLRKDFSLHDTFLDISLLCYFVISVFSVFQSAHLSMSLEAVQKLFRYLILFAAAREALSHTKRVSTAIRCFMAGGAFAGIDALIQFAVGRDLIAGRTPMLGLNDLIRLSGPFSNPNMLAIYLVYFIPLFYLVFRDSNTVRERWTAGFLLPVLIFALILTYSRPAALAICVIAFALVFIKRDFWILGAGAVVVAAGFFLAPSDVRAWMSNLDSWTGFFYDASRDLHHQAAWRMIAEHFWGGVGLGTFDLNYGAYRASADVITRWSAHQAYLQIWAETGIFGLLSFAALLAGILSGILKSFYRSKDHKNLILGFGFGVFGFLIIGFFESNFWQPRQTYFFWLWAGFLCALTHLPEMTRED